MVFQKTRAFTNGLSSDVPSASGPGGHMDGAFGVLAIGDDEAFCQTHIGQVNYVHPSFESIKINDGTNSGADERAC